LGHLIPIQEQLVDAKHRGCITTFEMFQNIPPDSRQLIDILNQRTQAFLGMTEAVIDYNKMIAEYTSATIAPSISGYRLVGALIELPKTDSPVPRPSSTEYAAPNTLKLSGISMEKGPEPAFAPRPLPMGRKPFPPIDQQPVIPVSYEQ
jgi:hypothetical protein